MILKTLEESIIKLDFKIGKIDGKSMSLMIIGPNTEKKVYSNLNEQFSCEIAITFPATVTLVLFNKGQNDTIVDKNQNVIEDKFIQLDRLQVDNLECNSLYLKNKLKLTTTNGKVIHDNYWGFNGTVILDFSQKNSIFWALETNSVKP